ncbi:MAG: hypothetical protein FGM24_08410 [Candidatus Kapabacteria bacterium]|nr:hypothetical protein [Candidatus Kapabacteria bacterium]
MSLPNWWLKLLMSSRLQSRYFYNVSRRRYSIQIKLYRRPGYQRGSLICHVYHQGKHLKLSLGHHHIWPEHWDETRQRMIIGAPKWRQINNDIDERLNRIVEYYTARSEMGAAPTLEGLRAHMYALGNRRPDRKSQTSFVAWFTRFIRDHNNNSRALAVGTTRTYKVVLTSWRAYEAHVRQHVNLHDLAQDERGDTNSATKILQEYRRFLIVGGPSRQTCSDNTVRKYLKIINTFLRWCEQQTGKQYIKKITIPGEITSKHSVALTQEDVALLENMTIAEGSTLAHVRDAVLMAIYTGLRHSEWKKVRPDLWREPSQLITSQKTGKICLVIHREPLREILRKYEATGFRKSIHSLQKMNMYIKELAKRAGLTRPVSRVKTIDGIDHHETVPLYEAITTHTFRRTKVTLELNQGRALRDIVMETGQDELVARKHYDRPDLDEHVRKLGIERYQEHATAV